MVLQSEDSHLCESLEPQIWFVIINSFRRLFSWHIECSRFYVSKFCMILVPFLILLICLDFIYDPSSVFCCYINFILVAVFLVLSFAFITQHSQNLKLFFM